MPEIGAYGFMGTEATQALFGANILATRHTLDQQDAYGQVIEELGVGSIRYPGGSLTERYFDIANPDASIVMDRDTGDLRHFIPLNEALSYAGQEGLGVTVVIPTRGLLSEETDANGDRFPQVDEDVLRGFVRDVVTGVHGAAEIEAFELGNEYWGSGQMSSVEYGRLASKMASVVNDELDQLNYDAQIIVQSGANFDHARLTDDFDAADDGADILADLNAIYGVDFGEEALFGSGAVNWTRVANELILSEFDTPEERDAVDEVAVHVYSKGQVNEGQRSFFLNTTHEAWSEALPEAGLSVTEWNTAGNTGALDRDTDYGLYQAHEMLNVMEEFMRYDVSAAHVWPVVQNTPNALSMDDGQAELTPAGEMFSMMQEALPGKTVLDLTPETGADTEVEEDGVSLHGFWEPREMVFYIAASGEDGADTTVDFSGLVTDPGQVEITVLSVGDDDEPGSGTADAVRESVNPEQVLDGTNLSVQMVPGDIMQVRMTGFTASQEFQDVIDESLMDDGEEEALAPAAEGIATDAAEIDLPTVPQAEYSDQDTENDAVQDEQEADAGGDTQGMADLMAMMPVLGLLLFLL